MHAMRGLLWEQWRQGRAYFLAGIAVLAAYFCVLSTLDPRITGEDAVGPAFLMGLLTLVLLMPNHSLRGFCWNIPARMSALPVSRHKVLVAMLLHRVGVALALGLGITLGTWWLGMPASGLVPTAAYLALAVWMPFFSLLVTRFGMLVGSLVSMIPPLLLLCVASFLLHAPLYPPVIVIGILGGVLAIARLADSVQFRARVDVSVPGLGEPGSKRRRMLAVCAHEWRQSYCWIPLLGILLTAIFLLVLGPYAEEIIVTAPIVVAFGAGFHLFQSGERMPSQFLLRPMSTRELAHSRMLAGAAACLLTVGATTFISAFVLQGDVPSVILVGSLLLWTALFAGRLLLVAGLLTLPLWGTLLALDSEAALVVLLPAAVMALLLPLYLMAWKKALIRIPELVLSGALAAVALLFFLDSASVGETVLAPIYTMLVLLPIPWVPLTIDWQRHR